MSKPKVDIDKFREKWLETRNMGESLIYAGGSPKTAARGYAGLNKRCKLIVDGKEISPPSDDELSVLMESLKTPEDISDYVRHKIIRAIELGESPKNLEGHLKLLGTLKEHNIFDSKKSNEIFVLAPANNTFDDLEDFELKDLIQTTDNTLILKPHPSAKGVFVDSAQNEFRVRISTRMREMSVSC